MVKLSKIISSCSVVCASLILPSAVHAKRAPRVKKTPAGKKVASDSSMTQALTQEIKESMQGTTPQVASQDQMDMDMEEELYLKPNATIQTVYIGEDSVDTNDDPGAIRCFFDDLVPDSEIYSTSSYKVSEDGTEVTDLDGITSPISIYNGYCADSEHTFRVNLDGEMKVNSITIVCPPSADCTEIYFTKDQRTINKDVNSFIRFTPEMVNFDKFLDEEHEIDDRMLMRDTVVKNLRGNRDLQTSNCDSQPRDGSSDECTCFTNIDIALVYDGAYCEKYGGHNNARSSLTAMLDNASKFYEKNMCLKLRLGGIKALDGTSTCSSNGSVLRNMNTDYICSDPNGGSLLSDFTAYMGDGARDALKIDELSSRDIATTHLVTGAAPKSGTAVGCAYIGPLCETSWAYGVVYDFGSNFLAQAAILAHEIGHNLSARHDQSSSGHLMHYSVGVDTAGMADATITMMLDHLQNKSCKYTTNVNNVAPPTTHPEWYKRYQEQRSSARTNFAESQWNDDD